MGKLNRGMILLIAICLAATAVGIALLKGISPTQLQAWVRQAGIWAPLVYILLYTLATILILPSTPLNLAGGAIFGPWIGTLWTTIAAVVAAVVAFVFTRTVGRQWIAQKLAGRWQAIDADIQHSGLFYMFALRLQPVIPYGLVNFAAGLSSISFKDYLIGTTLGTPPGILPFIMLGSYGLRALQTGDFLPLLGALGLASLLIAGAGWYYRRRRDPRNNGQKLDNSEG